MPKLQLDRIKAYYDKTPSGGGRYGPAAWRGSPGARTWSGILSAGGISVFGRTSTPCSAPKECKQVLFTGWVVPDGLYGARIKSAYGPSWPRAGPRSRVSHVLLPWMLSRRHRHQSTRSQCSRMVSSHHRHRERWRQRVEEGIWTAVDDDEGEERIEEADREGEKRIVEVDDDGAGAGASEAVD